MNTTTARTFTMPPDAPAAARSLFRLLDRLQDGSLAVQLPDGSMRHFGQHDPLQAPAAMMSLRNWNVCSATLKSGDIGFAETYIAGDWTTPHLSELLRVFIRNRQHIESAIYGTWTGRLLYRVRHLLRRNTRANSRKNIHAHYDLGNAFYELWLDDTMNYSSAWFDGDLNRPLRDAQHAKVRRALRMAHARPGDRVLEIGCGWGALAEMAVTEFGATLTGVTLSTEQLAYAQQRMAHLATARRDAGSGSVGAAERRAGPPQASSTPSGGSEPRAAGSVGAAERRAGPPQASSTPSGGSEPRAAGSVGAADLRLQDYRDIADGPYDAICSIEMVEAVGRAYWPTYFSSIRRLLKPGGRACIQSIVIDDALFDRYIESTDFIQQYIFPGGCLPCPREFRQAAHTAGLQVVDEFAFGADYAETLRRWRSRFLAERERVLQLGFDARFIRIWEFYLGYCEAAFDMANINLMQFTLRNPE